MKVSFVVTTYEMMSGSGRNGKQLKITHSDACSLFEDAFGIDVRSIGSETPFKVICTCEQFVQWQILRRDKGCVSRFRNLQVTLLQDGPRELVFHARHE